MVPETLHPVNDLVLLEESPPQSYATYKGYERIVIPQAFEHGPEDRPLLGTILSKGEGCVKPTIPVGAVALIGQWSGARFQRQKKHYLLVKESDILAVFE